MNASELTFGIEIETTVSQATAVLNGLQVGSYSRGQQVPYLPEGWMAKHDGSIQGEAGRIGAEIVSPILRGAEGCDRSSRSPRPSKKKVIRST